MDMFTYSLKYLMKDNKTVYIVENIPSSNGAVLDETPHDFTQHVQH